jgi:hypothetical protein
MLKEAQLEVPNELATGKFQTYRQIWEVRPANLSTMVHEDELTDFSGRPEVMSLSVAPCEDISATMFLEQWVDDRQKVYLWLICTDDIRLAEENGELGSGTNRGRLAHTNLCGLAPAYSGGELWFRGLDALYLSGASGRFTARSEAELNDFVDGFRASGYHVCSFGWDADNRRPARVPREETWQEPILI